MQHHQLKIIIFFISFIIMGSHLIEGKFEKYDMPKPIDPGGEEDLSVLGLKNGGNDIESGQDQEDCPFSQNDDDNSNNNNNNKQDDWQMIDLPHGDHQFDHVDHLPMMKMIDYNSWPIKMLMIGRKNGVGYLSSKKQQQHYDGGSKTTLKYPLIDAKKLLLEKKFHYKSKLSPPANYDQQQQQQQQPQQQQQDDNKKTVEYPAAITHMQQPIVTMFMNQKSANQRLHEPDQHNELIQQQDLLVQAEKDHHQLIAAVDTANGPALEAKQLTTGVVDSNYTNNQNNRNSQNNESKKQNQNRTSDSITSSNDYQPQINRARESFQAAAEFARQFKPINSSSSSSSREPESRAQNESVSDSSNFTSSIREENSLNAIDWDVETTTSQPLNTYNTNVSSTWTNNSQLEDKEKFLGFGQIYKSDNVRSTTQQARLSCSFGLNNELLDGNMEKPENVTISDVKWAKFVGNYDPDQVEPPFECKYRTCRVMEVKNDVWTTVHPRPAIQHYLGGQAQNMPSYSVTIHQVDPERHIGVYRCSAFRQIGDKKELVYRILPFL